MYLKLANVILNSDIGYVSINIRGMVLNLVRKIGQNKKENII